MPGRTFQIEGDALWHVKVGDYILASHHWPTIDIYSFTAGGQPWVAYEWLEKSCLGAVNRIGGLIGLDMLLIALGSSILVSLCYILGWIRSGNSKAAFIASAVIFVFATPSFMAFCVPKCSDIYS